MYLRQRKYDAALQHFKMDKCLTTAFKIFTLLTNVTLGFGKVANNRV
jgi:hypothetical protein